MTEKELGKLYARRAFQFDSAPRTLVSKSLVFPDIVPGIRKDFYDSSESPGYVIQNWMCSRNTWEFLRYWEIAEPLDFDNTTCEERIW